MSSRKAIPNFAAMVLDYEYLVYACNRCNSLKRERVVLDPCATPLADHVRVGADGEIAGLTPEGSDLIRFLGLGETEPIETRTRCLRILRLFQTSPGDPEIRALYLDYFGYPDHLPDLGRMRPRDNSREAGLRDTYFRQRAEGRLPETYF
jgi:hypothetical protein